MMLFALAAGAQQHKGDKANSTGIRPGPAIHHILLNTGVEIEYAEQGDPSGIPVIFLHGISDSWHSFESTLPWLPSQLRIFALSQRGHGNSQRPLHGYSSKDFAGDVADFIRQKKLGPVVIAGHSMGGVHATKFAVDYPELCRALVIIGSDPFLKKNEGMEEFHQYVMGMDTITREFMTDFQRSTLVKPIDDHYFNLLVDEGLKVPARVFKAALAGLLEVNFTGELEKLKMPVLIFWGEKDVICQWPGQEKMKRSFPNNRLVVYEGTGHALHWEEPEKFARDLNDFIHQLTNQQ